MAALRWPHNPGRPWVRARILATLGAGRCLLLGAASAGLVYRAIEGEDWGYYRASGHIDRCESAGDLAALILARNSTEEIRKAVEWAWRHEIEAAECEAHERALLAAADLAQLAEGRRLNRLADLGGGNR